VHRFVDMLMSCTSPSDSSRVVLRALLLLVVLTAGPQLLHAPATTIEEGETEGLKHGVSKEQVSK
jgi:hypothetical protein